MQCDQHENMYMEMRTLNKRVTTLEKNALINDHLIDNLCEQLSVLTEEIRHLAVEQGERITQLEIQNSSDKTELRYLGEKINQAISIFLWGAGALATFLLGLLTYVLQTKVLS